MLEYGRPESLYIAIIAQAFMDLNSKSKKSEDLFAKYEATNWLLHNNKDFVAICLAAGMDPDYVRRKAKQNLNKPTQWRATAGQGKRYHERRVYRIKQKEKKMGAIYD